MKDAQTARLVVGGGRAAGFPVGRPGDTTLNISLHARPDVCGDIIRAPFRSGTFAEVYFERVPFTAFAGRNPAALIEAARVLRQGGRLVIDTGRAAPVDEVIAGLQVAGFSGLAVSRPGFGRSVTLHIEAELRGRP